MTYKKLSLPDKCLVHRYLYYVADKPIISDEEYDNLERKAIKKAPSGHDLLNVGSGLKSSYSFEIREIAEALTVADL